MTTILSTDPQLSVPAPDPIGRLYRRPGSTPLDETPSGDVIIPSKKVLLERIASGEYSPSITNVIDVLNKPYLQTWAAKLSAEALISVEKSYPGRSVTHQREAVMWAKKEHERNRDAAAEKGTIVHEACEFLALERELDEKHKLPEYAGYIDAWKAWKAAYNPKFLALEVTVFGTTPRGKTYAGTADFVAEINGLIVAGDLKTTRSGLHDEVSLQLTAVSRAQQCTLDGSTLQDNFNIDAAIAVHLDPKGYTVKQARIDEEPWETFQGLLDAWVFNSFDGTMKDSIPSLSRSLTGPGAIVGKN
jgi:hypothetical protein